VKAEDKVDQLGKGV